MSVKLQHINARFAGFILIILHLNKKKLRKSFGSKNTYLQHLKSKKHKTEEEIVKNKNSEKEEVIQEIKPKTEALTTLQDKTICLFCNQKLDSIKEYEKLINFKQNMFKSET